MVDNRFLHDLAMERQARQSQMQGMSLPDIVRITKKEIRQSDCDHLDSESGYDSEELSGASENERDEDISIHPDHEDSVLSQSSARGKLESFLRFAEAAGLDKPSARNALSKSMGDEDR